MLRVFFGIPISEVAGHRLSNEAEYFRTALPKDLRWVEPEFLHITLKFISLIEPETLAKLAKTAENLAQSTEQFALRLKKIAGFPRHHPKVIAGYIEPSPQLLSLHKFLDTEAEAMGIKPELRRYRPHITLAKFKSTPEIMSLHHCEDFQMKVDEFVLYESRQQAEGSKYIPLQRFKLI